MRTGAAKNARHRRPLVCDSCTACCRGPNRCLVLDPRDDPGQYETYEEHGTVFLARKDNHDCVYLTDKGCSIYDRRPIICRKFDCRDYIGHPRLPVRILVQALKRT
jgi:Fe-S-cluster containining protein